MSIVHDLIVWKKVLVLRPSAFQDRSGKESDISKRKVSEISSLLQKARV